MTTAALFLLVGYPLAWDEPSASKPIEVQKVVVTLMQQAEVPARQQGVIVDVKVEEGDAVRTGELLARIDDKDAILALRRARIELDTANTEAHNTVKLRLSTKSLELAESELKRAKMSRDIFDKSVTDEEIQRRELAIDKAKLEIEQAEQEQQLAKQKVAFSKNELDIANHNAEIHRIVAPFDGIVVQVNRRKSEWVEPGVTVVRMLRINRLRAEGFLDSKSITPDLPGRRVTLTAKMGNGESSTFDGLLQFVSPEINPVDGRVRVWAAIDNPDGRLLPGMRATMTIDSTPNVATSAKPDDR